MSYISLGYYILSAVVFILYYILPLKARWCSLLLGSLAFYYFAWKEGWYLILLTALFSYAAALVLERRKSRLFLAFSITAVTAVWFTAKCLNFVLTALLKHDAMSVIVPMGISFYTLTLISYMTDIFMGKIKAEKNPLRFLLYVSFFPHILQGPIPRFNELSGQLYEGHRFDEDSFMRGILAIGWGFFLKLMIADKAALFVDTVFADSSSYAGLSVLLAGILYSLQLYADFSGCMSISKGVSLLFGIRLKENFQRPYFAVSIKDFWQRWHISLSTWLRDYIYIPLGGNRRGKQRKAMNLFLTFMISAIWHGAGFNFLFWGFLHAIYHALDVFFEKVFHEAPLRGADFSDSAFTVWIRRIRTFLLVMLAWIIFRSDSLRTALRMIRSIFWTKGVQFFDETLFTDAALPLVEAVILAVSLLVLFIVSMMLEKGADLSGKVLSLPLAARWIIYLIAIFGIMTFGTYGAGYDSAAFIYGGF